MSSEIHLSSSSVSENVVVYWASHMKDFRIQLKFLLALVNRKVFFSWPEDPEGLYRVSTWHRGLLDYNRVLARILS